VSSSKAAGLMQVLNGGKGIVIDKERVFDISYNIEKGIEIFNEHLRLQKGNLDKALFGYVGGDRSYANDIYKIIGEFGMYYEACKKAAEVENKGGGEKK
jgi:soluble lytic murein transglycosylase-like protein